MIFVVLFEYVVVYWLLWRTCIRKIKEFSNADAVEFAANLVAFLVHPFMRNEQVNR